MEILLQQEEYEDAKLIKFLFDSGVFKNPSPANPQSEEKKIDSSAIQPNLSNESSNRNNY